jgi:hypothetical protein
MWLILLAGDRDVFDQREYAWWSDGAGDCEWYIIQVLVVKSYK